MFPEANHGVFKGKEFPRLLLMLAILVVGWPIVLWTMPGRRVPAPPLVVAQVAPLPPPDDSLVFRGIQDRKPMSSRETPAYLQLVERARHATPQTLENVARQDVVFSQLLEDPGRYRGLPIHIVGTVRRVLVQEAKDSKVFPKGKFYEGIRLHPRQPVVPLRHRLRGAAGGPDDRRQHQSADRLQRLLLQAHGLSRRGRVRIMPVLVGRFPKVSPAEAAANVPVFESFFKDFRRRGTTWVLIGMSIYFAIRIGFTLRKAMRPKSTLAESIRNQTLPKDYIEPDALADFLGETTGHDDHEAEADDDEARSKD